MPVYLKRLSDLRRMMDEAWLFPIRDIDWDFVKELRLRRDYLEKELYGLP